MNTIEVKLFGAFKKYIPNGKIQIQVQTGTPISELKNIIEKEIKKQAPQFSDHHLILESALANAEEILSEAAVITNETALAYLPPVCGG